MVSNHPDGGERQRDEPAVAPLEGSLPRLVPAVLLGQIPHPDARMPLAEPSQDGPPDVVVEGGEHALRAPSMSVEVPPSTKDRIQHTQPIRERLGNRAPIKGSSRFPCNNIR